MQLGGSGFKLQENWVIITYCTTRVGGNQKQGQNVTGTTISSSVVWMQFTAHTRRGQENDHDGTNQKTAVTAAVRHDGAPSAVRAYLSPSHTAGPIGIARCTPHCRQERARPSSLAAYLHKLPPPPQKSLTSPHKWSSRGLGVSRTGFPALLKQSKGSRLKAMRPVPFLPSRPRKRPPALGADSPQIQKPTTTIYICLTLCWIQEKE